MVWYVMVWYVMVWYVMVWHVMAWYGMVWHGMYGTGMVRYGMILYGFVFHVWPGMVHGSFQLMHTGIACYGTIWCDMAWYNLAEHVLLLSTTIPTDNAGSPPVISRFINPIDYNYKYRKQQLLKL